MKDVGLVRVKDLVPEIVVSLMYSGSDNFMGKDVYGTLSDAYLHPRFTERLRKAQELLSKEKGASYALIIYDAARPLSVQRAMWNTVKDTPSRVYVASPYRGGGRHNYGLAVDLSIIDTSTGEVLDMGSPVDHFGRASHIGSEGQLEKESLITREARENRAYFHSLMKRVGLRPIRKEWWHLEENMPISKVRSDHRLLDF